MIFIVLLAAVFTALPFSSVTHAATLQPGDQHVSVDCNCKFQVTNRGSSAASSTCTGGGLAVAADASLELDSSDPIFSKTCTGSGISIRNRGRGAADRTFTLDCGLAGTLTGSGVRKGIQLNGPGVSVWNCKVKHFGSGIVANNAGADIEDSSAEDSAGDGIVIKNRVTPDPFSDSFVETTVLGNQSVNNGGFGFRIKANGVTADVSDATVFSNLAAGNALGGFSVIGKSNTLLANDAISNGGPGFSVIDRSCSFCNDFENARALDNGTAGIVYIGRDTSSSTCVGSACLPAGIALDTVLALGNHGQCPTGTFPVSSATNGQICLGATKCPAAQLNICP